MEIKKLALIAGGVAAVLLLTASSCDVQKDADFSCKDAPAACADGTNTKVILMPDGFRNVAFTCNGSTGIYVTSRGWNQNGSGDMPSLPSGIAVVANDPNC